MTSLVNVKEGFNKEKADHKICDTYAWSILNRNAKQMAQEILKQQGAL